MWSTNKINRQEKGVEEGKGLKVSIQIQKESEKRSELSLVEGKRGLLAP